MLNYITAFRLIALLLMPSLVVSEEDYLYDVVNKEEVDTFKERHVLSGDTNLSLQRISSKNTFSVGGKVYSLDGLIQADIFTSDATYSHNGKAGPVPHAPVFQKELPDNIIMTVVKSRMDDDIKSISITDRSNGKTQSLSRVSSGIFATIEAKDYDKDRMSKYLLKHAEVSGRKLSDIGQRMSEPKNIRRGLAQSCEEYGEVRVALAYESTFCAAEGGTEDLANDSVSALAALVSTAYQQDGLCMKIVISHLEGYCDSSADPYAEYVALNNSGCSSDGLLQGFGSYWEANRGDVERDVAHLLSGTGLECDDAGLCVIGCAGIGVTCDQLNGYGVNWVSFTSDERIQTVLLAHELGHNNGANHYEDTGYIMNAALNAAENGFSSCSICSFREQWESDSCVEIPVISEYVLRDNIGFFGNFLDYVLGN